MKPTLPMLMFVALAGCGELVRPDGSASDASEASAPREDAREDAREDETTEASDAAGDATELEDASEDAEVSDVVPDGERVRRCAIPEPPRGMELPGTNRSCDPDAGAPAEHCREVWQCGGSVDIYETPAAYFTAGGPVNPEAVRPTPSCDGPRTIAVHAGYVDAYEVSVARFRAWVRAGMPTPNNERMFPGVTVTANRGDFLLETRLDRESGSAVAQPEVCTYRDTPGENDNLPMNCVSRAAASYFCWWEGKHLLTDAAWVYVAGNSEWRTTYPFEVDRDDFDFCARGDFGRGTACAGRTGLPDPIDRYPQGATLHPAGIYGIYGGVTELTWGAGVPFDPNDTSRYFCSLSYDEVVGSRFGNFLPARGLAAYHSLRVVQALRGVRHRTSAGAVDSARRWAGFRCSRWVPELR
jgi:hypothetical protein